MRMVPLFMLDLSPVTSGSSGAQALRNSLGLAEIADPPHPVIESTAADEVMITGAIYDHAARKRSYELLAEAFGLPASA